MIITPSFTLITPSPSTSPYFTTGLSDVDCSSLGFDVDVSSLGFDVVSSSLGFGVDVSSLGFDVVTSSLGFVLEKMPFIKNKFILSAFIISTAPAFTSISAILLLSQVYFIPLTFTPFPAAEVLPPNTNISLPSEGAVNFILVLDSIFKHCVSVFPS